MCVLDYTAMYWKWRRVVGGGSLGLAGVACTGCWLEESVSGEVVGWLSFDKNRGK